MCRLHVLSRRLPADTGATQSVNVSSQVLCFGGSAQFCGLPHSCFVASAQAGSNSLLACACVKAGFEADGTACNPLTVCPANCLTAAGVVRSCWALWEHAGSLGRPPVQMLMMRVRKVLGRQ